MHAPRRVLLDIHVRIIRIIVNDADKRYDDFTYIDRCLKYFFFKW